VGIETPIKVVCEIVRLNFNFRSVLSDMHKIILSTNCINVNKLCWYGALWAPLTVSGRLEHRGCNVAVTPLSADLRKLFKCYKWSIMWRMGRVWTTTLCIIEDGALFKPVATRQMLPLAQIRMHQRTSIIVPSTMNVKLSTTMALPDAYHSQQTGWKISWYFRIYRNIENIKISCYFWYFRWYFRYFPENENFK